MPSLIKTSLTAKVAWLGMVNDSEKNIRSAPAQKLQLTFAGQAGECHSGLTRPSCSRVLSQYPRGTIIRNVRQISIVSEEELEKLAERLGVKKIDPSSIGASMVIKGIPDFTRIPPASRLQCVRSGATICIDMENRPCIFSGRAVEEDRPGEGLDTAKTFKQKAQGLRGVTAWVECEGEISLDDELLLHIPDQIAWPHLDQHLSDFAKRQGGEGGQKRSIFILVTFCFPFIIIAVMLVLNLLYGDMKAGTEL